MGEVVPNGLSGDEQDPLWPEALAALDRMATPGIVGLQRRLSIGYNRAARFMERFEEVGLVTRSMMTGAFKRTPKASP